MISAVARFAGLGFVALGLVALLALAIVGGSAAESCKVASSESLDGTLSHVGVGVGGSGRESSDAEGGQSGNGRELREMHIV